MVWNSLILSSLPAAAGDDHNDDHDDHNDIYSDVVGGVESGGEDWAGTWPAADLQRHVQLSNLLHRWS